MKISDSIVSKTFKFHAATCAIRSLLTEKANAFAARANKKITSLDCLHEVVDKGNLNELYSELYALMREPEFRKEYRKLIAETVDPELGAPFLFQKIPGVRVSLPESRTVQYHSDEWYGHGANIINFWMPITKAYETNSLYVATLQDSEREVRLLEEERAGMAEINSRLAALAKPIEVEYGEIFVFNARVVHGAETNTTGKTRVSLDFRIMIEGEDAGTKVIDEYYERLEGDTVNKSEALRKAGPFKACAYIFPRHGFTKHVPADLQRVVYQDFAKKNDVTVVAEETEIKTMSHHPTLLYLAEGKGTHKVNSVLAYSVLCLPEDEQDRRRIYRAAKETKTQLFFANEGLVYPLLHGDSEIESKRKMLQQ